MQYLRLSVLLCCLVCIYDCVAEQNQCKCVVARTGGDSLELGLFAQQSMQPWELLEVSIGVPVPLSAIYWNQLLNYVEGYNSSHCLLTLGDGLLINHHHNRNFVNTWKAMSPYPSQLVFRPPFQSSIDLVYQISSDVATGQQLFVDYGHDWFEERGLLYRALPDHWSPSLVETVDWPPCSQHYSVLRNGELFATRAIPAHVTVEVVRALLLPITTSLLDSGPLEEILWWLLNPSQTELLFAQFRKQTIRRPSNPYQLVDFDGDLTINSYALLLSGHGPFYGTTSTTSITAASTPNATTCNSSTCTDGDRSDRSDGGSSVSRVNIELLWSEEEASGTARIAKFVTLREVVAGEQLILDFSVSTNARHIRCIGDSMLSSAKIVQNG
jgi:hypothetical protein